MESMDTKEHKLQDQDQRQPAQTPDTCPNARRAKRMKCEVGVVEELAHTWLRPCPHGLYMDVFLNFYLFFLTFFKNKTKQTKKRFCPHD